MFYYGSGPPEQLGDRFVESPPPPTPYVYIHHSGAHWLLTLLLEDETARATPTPPQDGRRGGGPDIQGGSIDGSGKVTRVSPTPVVAIARVCWGTRLFVSGSPPRAPSTRQR